MTKRYHIKDHSPKTKRIGVEPAGAFSTSALSHYRAGIKGENIVCKVNGGNNDINRIQEIKERSMV